MSDPHTRALVMGPGDGQRVANPAGGGRQNAGDAHARILFVFTPGSPGMERFFERSAELPADTRMADAFRTLASDAGMEVLGPPLAPV